MDKVQEANARAALAALTNIYPIERTWVSATSRGLEVIIKRDGHLDQEIDADCMMMAHQALHAAGITHGLVHMKVRVSNSVDGASAARDNLRDCLDAAVAKRKAIPRWDG